MPDNFAQYNPPLDLRDEAVNASAAMHTHWQYLLSSLTGLGEYELAERQQRAYRLLREDGAKYTIYNQAEQDKTWPLDLIPWLIHSREWSQIEQGLQERAELFNLILRDLYGSRELIKRGIVPPELLLAHKGFLRGCDGISLAGDRQLILHSVDMMRSENGDMCILADRTQAPSGAGYALENRNIMWKVLPSLFRDSHVHQLTAFFQTLRHTLISLAPKVKSPHIAVLTPGALNETYFEHVYLANQLGFYLVQSSDLQVRDGYVWIKSIANPVRVDVLLRRVDDRFCDPVELKSDSELGIPGLMQVAREGKVAIANSLGSAALENPALLAYLPQISQHFLGRTLKLPSVKTWWCGDPEQLEYVLKNIDRFIIKPTFRTFKSLSVNMENCSEVERQKIIANLVQYPEDYVAQVRLTPSHLPVIDQQQLISRPVLLRSYAVAAESAYRIMPGGLTRVGLKQRTSLIANQLGSFSKDTWIIASEPEKPAKIIEIGLELEHVDAVNLPSRVAENLFWMGRYLERADSMLRLMRVVLNQVTASSPLSDQVVILLLKSVTKQINVFSKGTNKNEFLQEAFEECFDILVNPNRAGSVTSSIYAMIRCVSEVREFLSTDSQRIINDINDQVMLLDHALVNSFPHGKSEESLNSLVTCLIALSGSIQESMTRGSGWFFFNIGRKIERGIQTATLLESLMMTSLNVKNHNFVAWQVLLKTVENLYSYRRLYGTKLSAKNIFKHLLLDTANPRSLIYQLEITQHYLGKLPQHQIDLVVKDDIQCVLDALYLIRSIDLDHKADEYTIADYSETNQAIQNVRQLLRKCSNHLTSEFFAPSQVAKQLVNERWSLD